MWEFLNSSEGSALILFLFFGIIGIAWAIDAHNKSEPSADEEADRMLEEAEVQATVERLKRNR